MEILDLKFAGFSIWAWLIVIGIFVFFKKEYPKWKERRQWRKEFKAKEKVWMSENHWQPKMVGGVDCGEWVRNDGTTPDDDEWTPAGALLNRLEERDRGEVEAVRHL
jgi:hypothetical protein